MSKDFFNQRAAGWDGSVAEKDSGKLESMANRLGIEPGAAVLDVGTGTGVFVPYLLAHIGPSGSLVCLDYAEEMLKAAQRKDSTARRASATSAQISWPATWRPPPLTLLSVTPSSPTSGTGPPRLGKCTDCSNPAAGS